MLYLIGLGLEVKDLSIKALEAIKKCKDIYLEHYTTKLPYDIKELEKVTKKKVWILSRERVESDFLIHEAKKKNIALLVYGDPLAATTHISLLREAEKKKIPVSILHNVSVLNAVLDTGLHAYKFGKITSIPRWQENYRPRSFFTIVKENLSIQAHTLLLVDPGLNPSEALKELNEASEYALDDKFIIVCSKLGTQKQEIIFAKLKELVKKTPKVKEPFCIIVPAKMHFSEEEILYRKIKI